MEAPDCPRFPHGSLATAMVRSAGYQGAASNLANFLCTLALTADVAMWSLSTLHDRLVKIGAKIIRHGRSIMFQMAEVMVRRALFQKTLTAIATLRPLPPVRC